MYLKTLIITGFKSFPEKIRLDFTTGVTAVVGPNGSGKSNISDAARWVLGEQSAKSLRGSRMDDVIFSGTENRRSLGFAEVSMIIDNTDRRIKTEYTEITVTRRMYRSGEGEYSINGVPCRLKDIYELFMDTGIGREGYSIIGQGKIEEILSARSEDRRVLFEEAAGIIKFKTRKQEAAAKLDRERQNLLRVTDIIAELELQLQPLEEQAEQAKFYLNLKEELKRVQVSIFLIQIQSADKQLAEINESIRVSNSQQQSEKAKYENVNRIYGRLKSDLNEAEDKLCKLNDQRDHLHSKAEKTEINIKVMEERISNMHKAEERLRSQIKNNENSAGQKNKLLTSEREKQLKLNLENTVLSERLEITQKSFDLFTEGLYERDQKFERLNVSLMDRIKESSDCRNKIERIESQLEMLTERKDVMRKEREACDRRIVEISTLLSQEQKYADNTAYRIDTLVFRIQELQENAELLNTRLEQAALKESEVAKKLSETESRHLVLTDMERGLEGYRRSSKEILKHRQEFKGIIGAVGELARTPAGLETAIETALGSSIHDIVTETDKDALAAIMHLKETRKGRATFLPLNAIKPRGLGKNEDKLLGEPGVIGKASALILYNSMYERVFSYLLGSVIVMDNSSNALKISKKYNGIMIVSLDGELFNPGGSITGGSINIHGGLISRARELDELKRLITELQEQAQAYCQESNNIKAQIAAETCEIDEIRYRWQALMLENNTQQNTCRQLAETNQELNKKMRGILEECEKLAIKETEAYNALTPLQTAVNAAECEVMAIRQEIDTHSRLITGDRQKHEDDIKLLTDLKIGYSRVEQQCQSGREIIRRIESEIEVIRADNESLESELSSSCTERQRLTQITETMKIEIEEIHRRITVLAENIETLVNQRDGIRLQISETERKQRSGTEMLASLNNEVYRLEMRKEQIETESRRMYDDMWDEYQLTAQTAKAFIIPDQSLNQLNREERRLKNEIAGLGNVNMGAIEEFKTINGRYRFLLNQRSDILAAEEKLLLAISELTGLMEKQFTEQFAAISRNFSHVFREMFNGGKARLIMDTGNILESGIEIEVQPPGKNLQSMSLLSGGERALTAAALLFGILRLKPSPFCIFDEIEAALDEVNAKRFTNYIRRISNETQFILITHRKCTMEAADVLYGVTMQEAGVSKLVSIHLEEETA